MREKLAKLIYLEGEEDMDSVAREHLGLASELVTADQILSLLKEEIKKSLLTPTEIGDSLDLEKEYTYPCSDGSLLHTVDCRPAIKAQVNNTLKVLEEK